jgi:hypothetical protein
VHACSGSQPAPSAAQASLAEEQAALQHTLTPVLVARQLPLAQASGIEQGSPSSSWQPAAEQTQPAPSRAAGRQLKPQSAGPAQLPAPLQFPAAIRSS